MTPWKGGIFHRSHNPVINAIASEEQRVILDAVILRSSLTEGIFVNCLVASEKERSLSNFMEREALQIELFHTHLPTLKAAGLIAWDQGEGTVETTNHPALADPWFYQILTLDSDELDTALGGISHEYRRFALTVLKDEHEPMSIVMLTREIVQRFTTLTVPEAESVGEVSISLHHTHFPKLSEMNFITYDANTHRASYTANPTLEDVFRIIYDPDQSIVNKCDEFLCGLQEISPQMGHDRRSLTEWSHLWGESHHG